MAKSYICQLVGGKMLVFQDGWFGVETITGSFPDCRLMIAGRTYFRQEEILEAILGYQVEDMRIFMQEVSKFGPLKFDDFKYRVISQDIGGGCPTILQKAIMGVHDEKLTLNQALFKYTLPMFCIDDACVLPSDEDLSEEYSDMLATPWKCHHNSPNWKFRNNMILFTGCRQVTERHLSYIEDMVAIVMQETEQHKYSYLSGITLSNGNGAIVLCDSYIGNRDVEYLYQRVTGCDMGAGKIVSHVDDNGVVDAHFEYETSGVRRVKVPELHGVVVRRRLN